MDSKLSPYENSGIKNTFTNYSPMTTINPTSAKSSKLYHNGQLPMVRPVTRQVQIKPSSSRPLSRSLQSQSASRLRSLNHNEIPQHNENHQLNENRQQSENQQHSESPGRTEPDDFTGEQLKNFLSLQKARLEKRSLPKLIPPSFTKTNN